MRFIKRFCVKFAYLFLNGLVLIGRGLKRILPYFSKPFICAFRKIGRYLLLPIYKVLHYIKRTVFSFYSPARSKVFLFLTKKYIVHVLIVSLSMFVFVGNISAKDTRSENFGEQTIVYSLFNETRQNEYVEETAVFEPQDKILSYIDKSSQVENIKTVTDNQEATEAQIAEGLSAITSGGTSVIKPNITDTDFSSAPRTKTTKHTVSDGETISTIAEKYGISSNTILWANNLSATSVIKPEMELTILPVSGVSHSVVKGDTIKSLATKYDVEEDAIVEYNNLPDGSSIVIGENLMIPGGIKKPVYVAPKSYAYNSNKSVTSVLTTPSTTTISTAVRGSSTGSGMMQWPTSWRVITQYYNWKHTGLDIDGDYNSPIYSADSGVVTYAGWKTGYGNCYFVDHQNGIVTVYAHLSKFFAVQGQQVARGETLGMMGSTGWSTGTHLHFEVRVNGVKMNPLSYIR